jgi:hypothetical protein
MCCLVPRRFVLRDVTERMMLMARDVKSCHQCGEDAVGSTSRSLSLVSWAECGEGGLEAGGREDKALAAPTRSGS